MYCTVGHLCHKLLYFYFSSTMRCSYYRFNLVKVPTSIVWKWLDVISNASQEWMQSPIVRISTKAHFQLFLFFRKKLWRLLTITMGNTCHPLEGVWCGTIQLRAIIIAKSLFSPHVIEIYKYLHLWGLETYTNLCVEWWAWLIIWYNVV